MATSSRVVLLSGPEIDTEAVMRFRLTYAGELRPTSRDPEAQQPDPLAMHKHALRQAFHVQLKELWATNKFLKEHKLNPNSKRGHRPVGDDSEVPPISWTPEHLCSRSPQWPESTHRTRRSSGGK